MLTLLLFALGFVFLIKGADYLVEGAAAIAKKYKVSNLVIGLTIVSFGTSMPELVVSSLSAWSGSSSIALGNVIGSNIANVLLILGVAALIYPLTVRDDTVWKEIPLSILAMVMASVLVYDHVLNVGEPMLSAGDGLILLGFFTIFMVYIVNMARADRQKIEVDEIKKMPIWKAIGLVLIGTAGLALGGDWIVDGAVQIATNLGVSEAFVGLTIIAIGTSLPELAASAVAAMKKNADIAIGNVVGSNMFNICWVLGLTALIRPIEMSGVRFFDIGVMLLASILLFSFMHIGKKHQLHRYEGAIFLVMFVAYIGVKIALAA